MSEQTPKNRRERRAAAKESGKSVEPPSTAPKLKLAQPDRSKPKGKTLLDIYKDKQELLEKGQPFSNVHEDGKPRGESGNILEAGLGDDEPIGPLGNAFFWAVCLCMFHFTLDTLVYQQYAQDIVWSSIWKRTITVLPLLFTIIYIMRSETAKRWPTIRQAVFFTISTLVGCYTIHAGNKHDYFAVMKQAPPLGTIWVWTVIEMDLPYAAASVAIELFFLWWNGYAAF